MDIKSMFSALSFVAMFIYMYVGIRVYKQNINSKINRMFLLLCTSYAIWSFAYSFAYMSYDNAVFVIWNKISAIGWCTFSAISLYLVLLITENKHKNKNIVKFVIFTPAFLFLYMAVFLFWDGIETPILISNTFYIGNFLYNFIFLLLSIVLLLLWGIKSNSKRIKIQSKILVISASVPFIVNLLAQNILPLLGFKNLPLMGQLFAVFLIIGIYIVINKYKFLKIPEKAIYEGVVNKILDMVIVVNEKGELIKISRHTLDLLDFNDKEILNNNIMLLFDDINKDKFTLENLMNEEIRYHDIEIIKKNGERIPVDLACIPIWDPVLHDFLGAAIIMQDIRIVYELRKKNEELFEKTIRDGLTKLYNHQYMIELIDSEIERIKHVNNKIPLSLMMIDIDYFKKVNDTYGHIFGDYVLKTVSQILVNVIRNKGHVGRFGGEEFMLLLPNIDITKACEIAETIRREIENYEFNEYLKLTVSIGVNQFNNQSSIEFIKDIDDLLYKAKENGRNRVAMIQ